MSDVTSHPTAFDAALHREANFLAVGAIHTMARIATERAGEAGLCAGCLLREAIVILLAGQAVSRAAAVGRMDSETVATAAADLAAAVADRVERIRATIVVPTQEPGNAVH